MFPNSEELYNQIAFSYRKLKDYKSALENVSKSIELNPKLGIAYSTLAEIYADMGKEHENEFYINIELALMFGHPVWDDSNDESYQPYLTQERFKKLLEKYKP